MWCTKVSRVNEWKQTVASQCRYETPGLKSVLAGLAALRRNFCVELQEPQPVHIRRWRLQRGDRSAGQRHKCAFRKRVNSVNDLQRVRSTNPLRKWAYLPVLKQREVFFVGWTDKLLLLPAADWRQVRSYYIQIAGATCPQSNWS